MSWKQRILNVGASLRASDGQAIANAAASADDRALEVAFAPGAAQKAVMPLSEESATVNPGLLVVGQDTDVGVPNGKARVRPSHFKAGVSGDAYSIALSASLKGSTDSIVFAFNSSGSTRTDLLYAILSYQTTKTESVRVKPPTGGDPVSQNLTTEKTPTVTLGIVANVASGNPLASLPADDTVNGVYNFGLAAVSIPNGWSGAGITQSQITQLWAGGFVSRRRVRTWRPGSLIGSGIAEAPASTAVTARNGSGARLLTPVYLLPTTKLSGGTDQLSTWPVLDNSISWLYRMIRVRVTYLTDATSTPEGILGSFQTLVPGSPSAEATFFVGTGRALTDTSPGGVSLTYITAANGTIFFAVGSDGALRFGRVAVHGASGDLIMVDVEASDQMLANA